MFVIGEKLASIYQTVTAGEKTLVNLGRDNRVGLWRTVGDLAESYRWITADILLNRIGRVDADYL
jgi:hypothetical protein